MRKVTKIKIRYYSRETLKYLLLAGVVYIAASNPRFAANITKNIARIKKDLDKEKARRTFNYLRKKGLIEVERVGYDVRVTLTKEGKKLAGKYQIDDLEVERPKKWDGKWRVIVFDIPNASRLIRDVFRRKLKEWGFYRLQQSVWISPCPCREEIDLLRGFLGASTKQIQVLQVDRLENENFLKKTFKL